jgi:hypothetical protein
VDGRPPQLQKPTKKEKGGKMYRVIRKDDRVQVQRLDKPDLLGNTHWYIIATLNATDITDDGRTVGELSDSEIIGIVRHLVRQ